MAHAEPEGAQPEVIDRTQHGFQKTQEKAVLPGMAWLLRHRIPRAGEAGGCSGLSPRPSPRPSGTIRLLPSSRPWFLPEHSQTMLPKHPVGKRRVGHRGARHTFGFRVQIESGRRTGKAQVLPKPVGVDLAEAEV